MLLSKLLDKIRGKDINANDINRFPKDTYLKISDFFREENVKKEDVIIVCIGTNRTQTIDCLGPFVGSILKEDREFNVPVYGTMINPIHALNMTKRITDIKNTHPKSIIIAIDASLSDDDKIGQIAVEKGSIKPAAGINKEFHGVGDYSIKGFVGPKGINVVEYHTDLNFIRAMAYTIAEGLKKSFV